MVRWVSTGSRPTRPGIPNDPDEIMKLWRAIMETPEKVAYTDEKAKAILARAMAIMQNTTDPDEIQEQSEAVTKLWERVWEKKYKG